MRNAFQFPSYSNTLLSSFASYLSFPYMYPNSRLGGRTRRGGCFHLRNIRIDHNSTRYTTYVQVGSTLRLWGLDEKRKKSHQCLRPSELLSLRRGSRIAFRRRMSCRGNDIPQIEVVRGQARCTIGHGERSTNSTMVDPPVGGLRAVVE